MKIFLSLLPSLFMILSLLHGNSESATGTCDLLVDRSQSGYRVGAIRGWEVRASEPGDAIDTYFSHPDPSIEINIIVLEKSGVDTLDNAFLELVYEEASAAFGNPKRQHISISSFQRRPAGSYSFTAIDTEVSPAQPLFLHQQIILDGERFLVISIACEPDAIPMARPLWTAFLQQIELVEPGS